jgi:hypothetical protein
MKTFSPTDAITFGWNTFKANVGFSLGLIGILIAVQVIFAILTPDVDSNITDISEIGSVLGVSLIYNLIGGAIAAIISLGVIKALLNLADTGKGSLADILIPFKQTKILINYVLALLLLYVVLIVALPLAFILGIFTFGLGFLVLIPLAIFLNVRLNLFTYFIADKAVNPVEAFKLSWNATKGNFWNLIGFYFLSLLVLIAGLIALIVGVLVAIPVVMIATVYVYRKLAGGKPSQEAAPATTVEQPAPAPTPEPAAPVVP